MKRLVQCIFLSLLFLFLIPTPSHAVLRYAECDACGYCIDREAPESWESCKACLYPLTTGAPSENKTLEIITNPADARLDPAKKALNQPVPPARGKYFTQLGCVDTSLSSFSDPGAVGGVLNFLLTKLIFPSTGVLAFGALIYGAFLLLTAQGAEMQIASGKRYVTGAIVGLIFTFSIVLVVNIIGGDVLRIPGLNSGTKITFIGYGTSTTEDSIKTFPSILVQYGGQTVGAIKSVEGSASSLQEYTVYLPTKIDLSNQVEVDKVTFLFDNDKCIDCHSPDANHFGDRNVYNTKILFEGTPCTKRTLFNINGSVLSGPFDDGVTLQNNWDTKPIRCTTM
ncbi:hypothetical protein CO051_02920 [Candidatus Roizmanbacteria bacterium CG_4_9_14_0_2_um_filter_39_13]|uniref:IPT/TIG domain-containing protein n=1 Tax=Candidatus Roizmanbacteria bacterium CG_4_9_14_0_2_um_filter_39_13 TaxID=1974839 RepID=A0A2M8EZZ8_9BACT|nr:MAG: hypothetical protein CO051_02920 [Candidatus Roizmanbacteria bacterium CG_4_9_14_0_2_um_filter_39_13]